MFRALAGPPGGADPRRVRAGARADGVRRRGVHAPPPANDLASAAIRFYQALPVVAAPRSLPLPAELLSVRARAIERYRLVAGTARAADRLIRCDRSSERFYTRATNGRMIDPVAGVPPDPNAPRVPAWLLPPGQARSRISRSPFASRSTSPARSRAGATATRRHRVPARRVPRRDRRRPRRGAAPRRRLPVRRRVVGGRRARVLSAAMLTGGAAGAATPPSWQRRARFSSGDFSACGAILDGVAGSVSEDAAAPAATNGDAITTELRPTRPRGRAHQIARSLRPARGNWSVAHDAASSRASRPTPGARRRGGWRCCPRGRARKRAAAQRHRLATALSIVSRRRSDLRWPDRRGACCHLFFNGALIYSIVKLVRPSTSRRRWWSVRSETPFYLGNVSGAHNAATVNRSKRMGSS